MGLFQSFDISASGMTAERFRTDIIAQNIANVNTTRTEDGTPYRRKVVTFAEKRATPFQEMFEEQYRKFKGTGVKVTSVKEDTTSDYIMEYDPAHPDADENGYVDLPNINVVEEMVGMVSASKAYQANAAAAENVKTMIQSAMNI